MSGNNSRPLAILQGGGNEQPNFDLADVLNRIVERAAQNLTIEKLLIQLNLDPNNITFDVDFHRLVDVALANINIANSCALIGAGLLRRDFSDADDGALRVFGIFSALFFMAYGAARRRLSRHS